MGNIKIIGTHHLMKREEIEKEINKYDPEIVLIELCNGRISMINHPNQRSKETFSLLGMVSNAIKKKAKSENVVYGGDMISAYKIAKERKIPIGLIDRPVVETKVLFSAIPLREKYYFIKELIKFKSNKVKVGDIINEVSDKNIEPILNEIKSSCPNFYYYLISSRDEYMVMKIKSYLYDYPNKKILVFVGKGHLKKIEESLNSEIKPAEEESSKGGKK